MVRELTDLDYLFNKIDKLEDKVYRLEEIYERKLDSLKREISIIHTTYINKINKYLVNPKFNEVLFIEELNDVPCTELNYYSSKIKEFKNPRTTKYKFETKLSFTKENDEGLMECVDADILVTCEEIFSYDIKSTSIRRSNYTDEFSIIKTYPKFKKLEYKFTFIIPKLNINKTLSRIFEFEEVEITTTSKLKSLMKDILDKNIKDGMDIDIHEIENNKLLTNE